MSNYEDDQSEDGELARSPVTQEEMDFSLSEELDTGDSLDIKPPQAKFRSSHPIKEDRRSRHSGKIERHKDSQRREKKHTYRDRDKQDVRTKRDNEMTRHADKVKHVTCSKEHYGQREYRRDKDAYREREHFREHDPYREKEFYRDKAAYRSKEAYRDKEAYKEKEPYRDKESYREKEARYLEERSKPTRHEVDRKVYNEKEFAHSRYNEKENRDKLSGDKELDDLRCRLLSKRNSKEQLQDPVRKRDDHSASSSDRDSHIPRDAHNPRNSHNPRDVHIPRHSRLPELDRVQQERRDKLLENDRERVRRQEALVAGRKRRLANKRPSLVSPPPGKRLRPPAPLPPDDIVTVSDNSDTEVKSSPHSNQEEGEHSGTSSESSDTGEGETPSEEEEEEEEEDDDDDDEEDEDDDEDQDEDRHHDEVSPRELQDTRIEDRRSTEPPTPRHAADASPASPVSLHSLSPRPSRSRTRSRSHSFSPPPEEERVAEEPGVERSGAEEVEAERVEAVPPSPPSPHPRLPPYFPALQGCRSVEEFQCLNRIEEGTYGVVYRARDKTTEEIVALKRLKMEKEKEGFPITSLREINTLLKGQHPNIVTVREIVVGSNMDKIFIVMDYVEHDLKGLMETMRARKQVFLPGEIKCLMRQLLQAVEHLHDNWILHRDLKTSNLLLSHKGVLKVGDFGLAREYGSPLKAYTPVVVTLWYRAPELLLGARTYSTPIDMWSVGCIFAEFISMHALFPGKSEVDQLNRIFKELGTPNETVWPGWGQLAGSKAAWAEQPGTGLRGRLGPAAPGEVGLQLLTSLLTYDPTRRDTATQALAHYYFKELPLAIDPAMFPTWPAKSEGGRRHQHSPKPPSGGDQYKLLSQEDPAGFHMGAAGAAVSVHHLPPPLGFSLKF